MIAAALSHGLYELATAIMPLAVPAGIASFTVVATWNLLNRLCDAELRAFLMPEAVSP